MMVPGKALMVLYHQRSFRAVLFGGELSRALKYYLAFPARSATVAGCSSLFRITVAACPHSTFVSLMVA